MLNIWNKLTSVISAHKLGKLDMVRKHTSWEFWWCIICCSIYYIKGVLVCFINISHYKKSQLLPSTVVPMWQDEEGMLQKRNYGSRIGRNNGFFSRAGKVYSHLLLSVTYPWGWLGPAPTPALLLEGFELCAVGPLLGRVEHFPALGLRLATDRLMPLLQRWNTRHINQNTSK